MGLPLSRPYLDVRAVTFPQCALGGDFKKWTTLWYSGGLRGQLDRLSACSCQHQGAATHVHAR